jgi:hypothetical protein
MYVTMQFKKVDKPEILDKPTGPLPRMYCATVVERRPLIKHMEPWEDEYLA